MQVDMFRDAAVIRFWPVDPSAVIQWAAKEHRRSGRFQLSVFAATPAPGESRQAVEARLVRAVGLAGRDLSRQSKYFVCTAGVLLDSGFTFWKGDEPGEPGERYSVDLGEHLTLGVVIRFLGLFGVARGLAWPLG